VNGRDPRPIHIVGGGLAGLGVAALLSRRGRSVTVLERASRVGGRARSDRLGDQVFNLGPRALYRDGEAWRLLTALGLPLSGRVPSSAGLAALLGAGVHPLPSGPWSLLRSALLTPAGKLGLARALSAVPRLSARALAGTSTARWLDALAPTPDARRLLAALVRLTTYVADHEALSAEAAVLQLQRATRRGVVYLDDGWQSLVDGLVERVLAGGGRICTGVRVDGIEHDGAVRAIRVDGERLPSAGVVLAVGPTTASRLVPGLGSLARFAARARPVEAACLDLGLDALPRPARPFALGLDRPSYVSAHSVYAQLGPGATIAALRYLGGPEGDPGDPEALESGLQAEVDVLQPGWRARRVQRRLLPRMTVTHALPTAEDGGLAGRPDPVADGIDGLYLAGDWVGDRGLLADASLASAERVAEAIDSRPDRAREAA
jgi:phytoene dehydrogenase-like protein